MLIGLRVLAGSFVYLLYMFVSSVLNDVVYLNQSFIWKYTKAQLQQLPVVEEGARFLQIVRTTKYTPL